MNMILKALLLSAVVCSDSPHAAVQILQQEVDQVEKASFIELSGSEQVIKVTKAFVTREEKTLEIYQILKNSKNPSELNVANNVINGLSESLLKKFLDKAEPADVEEEVGALLREVETDEEFKGVVLPQEVDIVAGLKRDEKKDALDEPKRAQLDAFKNQVAKNEFKQYAEVDTLSNDKVQKDEDDEALALKEFEINNQVAALTLQVYDLSKASEEVDLSQESDEVKSKFESIIELLLKDKAELSEEELNSVQEILKIKVLLLFDIKKQEDSEGEELTEGEQKALERILDIISKDDLDLLYHEIIEKNFINDLIASVQSEVEVSKDSVESTSRIGELSFSPRRDDRLYSQFLDLQQGDLSTEEYEAEKKRLEEAYINGYTPALWESYEDEENLLSLGSDESKNYVNIPIHLNFTEEHEGYSKESVNSYYNDIRAVMDNLRQETCVNFSEVENMDKLKANVEQQYIEFRNDELRGCDEIIGRKSIEQRPQIQALSTICLGDKGSMAHYFMHNLGFDNEHQRPDVKLAGMIVREDMEQSDLVSPKVPKLHNRLGMNDLKIETDSASFLTGVDYDRYSVMHWSHNFIQDNENALFPHMRTGMETFFSDLDIEKINILYNCNVPKLFEAIEDVCHYNVISDGEVEVSEACLYDDSEDGIKGNAHVHVAQREGYKAIVNLSYNLEEGQELIESADSAVEADDVEADNVDAANDAPLLDDTEVEGVEEDDAEEEMEEIPVEEEEIEVEEEETQQDSRLLQEEEAASSEAASEEAESISASADEELVLDAAVPSEDEIEVVEVEEEDAIEVEEDAVEADEAVEADDAEAAKSSADDAEVLEPITAEEDVVSHLKDVVFDEENTQEQWESEFGVDFENSELDNSSNCTKAQLGVSSEESANSIFCGSKIDDRIEGSCGKDLKISYRLVDTSNLYVVSPSLKVNVEYEACSDQTAALIDTESSSNVISSYVVALMSLF